MDDEDFEHVTFEGSVGNTEKKVASKEIKIGKDSGRVKVFVRVRPFSKDEKNKRESMPYELSEKNAQLKVFADDRGHAEKTYIFDNVFPPNKTNPQVCDTLTQPLVQSAMNGFNGTLMAYGQTGSGKTYTLMSDNGITRSLIDSCFSHIQDDVKHNYKVTVSYLQIYQEKIFDLLNNNNAKTDLTIRENPRTGKYDSDHTVFSRCETEFRKLTANIRKGIYVENLTEYVVRTPSEVLQFLAMGKKRLVFAETKMNRTSSRSHSVLQMAIERTLKEDSTAEEESKDLDTPRNEDGSMDPDFTLDLNSFGKDVIIKGKIHICDLAGSERIKRTGAFGDRLSEAQHINSSLLELGNVIQALADEKATHVPFRNSVLTRLLQESLGGNCKTSLIVCISPASRDLQETKCTLNFGSRAMKVTNTAYVNMEVDFKSLSDQLLKQLQAKEEEMHQIRLSCKQQVETECQSLRLQLEQKEKESLMSIEFQKQLHADEVLSLQEQIYLLNNEIEIKNEQIQQIEDSLFVLDDEMKRDKGLNAQYIKTDYQMTNWIKSNWLHCTCNESRLRAVCAITNILTECIDDVNTNASWTEQEIMHSLIKLEDGLNKQDTTIVVDIAGIKTSLQLLTDQVQINEEILVNSSNSNLSAYNMYLTNRLHQVVTLLDHLSVQEEITKIKTDNQDLLSQIHRMQQESNEKRLKTVETSTDSTDSSEINNDNNSVEVQADTKVNTSSNHNNRKLIKTTVEDEEKVVTEIKTENVIENPDLKSSRDIFSGFGHNLGRIEDMMASYERKSKPVDSIASRFGLSSYFRDEELRTGRSSSVLGFRSDGQHGARYGASSLHKSFSGSASKLNLTDAYDSKHLSSRNYSNSLYRSSKYEPRTCGNPSDYSNLTSYNSVDNLTVSSSSHEEIFPSSNTKQQDQSVRRFHRTEEENKKLEEKCRNLENEVAVLRQQNSEYISLFQEAYQITPNSDKLTTKNAISEIRNKVKNKQIKIDICTQTDDPESNYKKGREYNSPKVAHIKPYTDARRSFSPANIINVSYDLNENDVVRNIASTSSYAPQIINNVSPTGFRSNPGSPYLSRKSYHHRSNSRPGSRTSIEQMDSNGVISGSSVTNLMEFSPEEEKIPLSQAVKQARQSDRNITSRANSNAIGNGLRETRQQSAFVTDLSSGGTISSRERPQTWYGFQENAANSHTKYVASEMKKNFTSQNRELNLATEQNSEEVVFSRGRRGSWSIPDWMKTKKKTSSSSARQLIQ